ncbi:MAG: PKD domain-containing protein, partial [Bacteroidota bacterium]
KKYEWEIDGVIDLTSNQHDYNTSFSVSGIHTARLIITDINGCIDSSATKQFTITGPTAVFSVGSNGGGCKNGQVQFTDASIPAVGNINKWSYDFGDGSPLAAQQNPKHTYADTGVYTVRFTVTDDMNCDDTFDTTAVITMPVPFFSTAQTTFCPGAPLPFKDSSSGKGLQYSWDFGDGGTDNVQNPLHSYPAGKDSIYSVKLIVTDTVGCSDSLTRSSYITTKGPKPLYSAKDTVSLCPPLETKFTFKGQDFESFSWDFGDGGTSTLVNTSHFYNTYGTYIAKLYTVGYGGCIDSASIPVSVLNPNAAASLTYTPNPAKACNELTVNFALTVPTFTAFTVFFGDGTYDTTHQPTFSHFYSLPNNYGPYIFLTDSTGCQASVGGASGTIQIQGAVPLFGMDKNKFCDTGAIFFSDYSQDAVDPIVSKTWDFGDGTAPGPLPVNSTHTYTQAGLYVPTLAVTTQAGCTQTFTDTVRVLATPKPVITSINAICKDLMIDFAGSLLVPPDTAISWKWSLGENQASSLQNVSVKYADSGIHHITLEASNSLGCKGDTSKDIIVNPLPAITVNGDTTLIAGAGGIVMPITYSANATTFNWTPSTYLSCTDCASPFANPKFTTAYNIKVTDANGCINSRNVTLLVVCNNKNFFIPNTFSPNNDGSNDRFYPRGTGLDRIQALRIFNRWGELVFEKRNFPANDAASGWDGTYRGKTASTDTYIYMIDIICENANIITYKGNVTLIR